MKIIKINDHQIRCTLTPKDLEKRQLKINEIAYGTDKVKALFRDMMRQASFEFGFEAEDIPLMIEAIPFAECVVIIITKVEDPEELDTRFSKFAPSIHTHEDEEEEEDEGEEESDPAQGNSGDLLDIFRKISELGAANLSATDSAETEKTTQDDKAASDETAGNSIFKIFSFDSLYEIPPVAKLVDSAFHGESTLYSNPVNHNYLLVISQGAQKDADFTRIYNTFTEYARVERTQAASKAYLEEHFEPVLATDAIHKLAELS